MCYDQAYQKINVLHSQAKYIFHQKHERSRLYIKNKILGENLSSFLQAGRNISSYVN